MCLDIADLRDGRWKPLSQPSTRHENPVCTLTLGALRGVPAEGGVPATAAPVRGKAFTQLEEVRWRLELGPRQARHGRLTRIFSVSHYAGV
ncbi:hypothetical protein HYPDE_40683 [Hyphomicrobium denitrificans 1NES1]|uniref:Uncharacterized protein n=1 Tax=Hyphomicrobium denitrificans 1NES1 TaxID=670307 RepID=N0BI28_9HYPH|nr:hypothetical protein HYPDE_40683 [Hyphomicrobium denitrificans 1NES1]